MEEGHGRSVAFGEIGLWLPLPRERGDNIRVPPSRKGPDPFPELWRSLTLQPGAPECVLKEAHRFHIRLVHPDHGGSDRDAKRVNVAFDKLKGHGSAANEWVSRHYEAEPFFVLGLAASGDTALAMRVGKALSKELAQLPRLVRRVEWAIANFGIVPPQVVQAPRAVPKAPPPAPPPTTKPWLPSMRRPDFASRFEGLPASVNFGAVAWGSEVELVVRLTWSGRAPTNIQADVGQPFRVSVAQSSVRSGRVALKLVVDWASSRMMQASTTEQRQQVRFEATLTLQCDDGSVAKARVTATSTVPATGVDAYPPHPPSAVPQPKERSGGIPRRHIRPAAPPTPRTSPDVQVMPTDLDLGSVRLQQPMHASLTIRSSRKTMITLQSSTWLSSTPNGRFRVEANEPVEVVFEVDWLPIVDRGGASIRIGRPLRPSGNIHVRWAGGSATVPVKMLVTTARQPR